MNPRTDISQIAIVIVLFHPSESDVDNVRMLASRYRGVIVDNSDLPSFPHNDKVGMMRYMALGENRGIAEAHSRGISALLNEKETAYIILLDQDSRLPDGYPQKMVDEFEKLKKGHPHLAALGPTVVQKDTGEEYHSAIHQDYRIDDHLVARKDIIASGCCFTANAFRQVGLYENDLFIDFVDTEWCYRAVSKGYAIGITPNVKLYHKVGKKEIHIGRHIVSISAPFRYYYQYRNFIILAGRKYVPMSFKINFGIKFLLRFFYIPLMTKDGWSTWKYMLKGICAGISSLLK
ncbi:MAG: glycosyltransferase [Prevotella sp.]|nr:glycosyltransferase [Prevotella sp.]